MKKLLLFAFFSLALIDCDSTSSDNKGTNNPSPGKTLPSILFEIIKTGSLSDLEKALALGNDPNAVDEEHNTPLMKAAAAGKGDFFKALVTFGADARLKNKAGQMATDLVENLSIEEIGTRLSKLDPKEKAERERLKQLSLIKRYAAISHYQIPEELVVLPNPGAGSCFFYSIAAYLKDIFPGQYNDFKSEADVRDFLATFFSKPAGIDFAATWIPIMKAADPARYDRLGKEVNNADDLVELITNSGKFAGETFWGDELTDGLVKELADIVIIKFLQRAFAGGKSIFYCQGDIDKKYVAVMKYHEDIHFEATKLVLAGKPEQYSFDTTRTVPALIKDLINAYNWQCKQ